MKKYDVIIVGGGIIGAACARELSQHGKSVLVLDAATPGCKATSQCMGHVVIMDDSATQMNFTLLSSRLWDEEIGKLPEDCDAQQSGTLWVAEDDEEMEAVYKKHAYYASFGVKTEIVERNALYKYERHLKEGLRGALRVPGDRVVYPANCTRHFLKNIDVWTDTEVSLISDNALVLKNGQRLEADVIINAAGVNAVDLFPDLPVEPRKGHLLITDRYPGYVQHQIVELGYLKSAHGNDPESVAFNVQPRPNGQILVGSSREYVGLDESLNRRILAKMLDRACYYMPGIKKLKGIRAWTGFRPASRDGYPFIGPHPTIKGLFIACGHEGLGITTSLGTAKLLTAQILGEKPPVDAHPFRVERIYEKEKSHAEH